MQWISIIRDGLHIRVDSRFAPSQWETVFPCNDVSLAGCKPKISLHIISSPNRVRISNITRRQQWTCLFTDFCVDFSANSDCVSLWHLDDVVVTWFVYWVQVWHLFMKQRICPCHYGSSLFLVGCTHGGRNMWLIFCRWHVQIHLFVR